MASSPPKHNSQKSSTNRTSSSPKPNSPPKHNSQKSSTNRTSSSPKPNSPKVSQAALKLAYTLGSVFLPTDVEIIHIGKILGESEASEWNDKVTRVDMYSDPPYELLAEAFPTIKIKNTYLVWTPRRVSKKGSGIDRDLKSPKGGYWYAGGGKIPVKVGEKVVGYCRILKFYEGGKRGRGGEVTDWCMREFFCSEGFGNDFVICTVVFENLENKKFLNAFDGARNVLEGNATSSRGTKLETDRAISKGGKRAPQAKAKESVVGSAGSARSAIDVGIEIGPLARRTRSQSIKLAAEASGSGTGQKDADKKEGAKLNRFLLKGNKLTVMKRGGTSDASTPTIVPVHAPVQEPLVEPPPVVPLQVPALPVQAPAVAPRVGTGSVGALGRRVGLSVARLESMTDEQYYNIDEEI